MSAHHVRLAGRLCVGTVLGFAFSKALPTANVVEATFMFMCVFAFFILITEPVSGDEEDEFVQTTVEDWR